MERTNFLSYLGVLQELAATLEELTSVQQEKTQVVRADDLAGLNECMKREQALSLALRSLDQRRETALAAMGLREVPLSGLTAQAPEDCREETDQMIAADRMYCLEITVEHLTGKCGLEVLRSRS